MYVFFCGFEGLGGLVFLVYGGLAFSSTPMLAACIAERVDEQYPAQGIHKSGQ